MNLRSMTTMTCTRTKNMEHTFSVRSKKQLMEQLNSEQKEADAITQPLLDTEAGFIKNLELYLNHRDTSALKKRELLHKRWTECVWLPVQRSIKQHFTQHGYETKNMRSLYTHYLNYCNAKGFVFLDSYDPLDYNPFMHHFNRPQHHKVSTSVLQDPLNLQSRGMIKEKMAILRCQTGHACRRRQRVDELLHSFPVYQHKLTQPQPKSSRNTASERLWKDRSLCEPRRRGTPCLSLPEPQCWSSYGYRHHVLPSMEICESISENEAEDCKQINMGRLQM
ncbi:protein FAM228A [Misgurnus anguillicaudatus]|uniref:protein FAM228A n=1 Tax=Misgurnus anguillicaudatus TaxID=75329 RepID=UPI003CCFC661